MTEAEGDQLLDIWNAATEKLLTALDGMESGSREFGLVLAGGHELLKLYRMARQPGRERRAALAKEFFGIVGESP